MQEISSLTAYLCHLDCLTKMREHSEIDSTYTNRLPSGHYYSLREKGMVGERRVVTASPPVMVNPCLNSNADRWFGITWLQTYITLQLNSVKP